MINKVDGEYFRLLRTVLDHGRRKENRTGVDTIGVFGEQAKFDVKLDAFPILTTKKVWFKGIVHELLWFINGDTNIKYLVDNDVHIWDDWAFARYQREKPKTNGLLLNDHLLLTNQEKRVQRGEIERDDPVDVVKANIVRKQNAFIEEIKNNHKFAEKWGELGEGTYGSMWRKFPYHLHEESIEDGVEIVSDINNYVDQLSKVIDKLKTNPEDRRMIVSAWHPYWVDHCALPPCHCLFHFNTEELTNDERDKLATEEQRNAAASVAIDAYDKKGTYFDELTNMGIPKRSLNLLLYQRSCDTFLGVPFNITSYSLLLAMIAHCVGMEPGTFTHTYGDLHIYDNHLPQVAEQLTREPMKLPKLWINPNVKDLFALTYNDIKLIDYLSHPSIKGDVAV